MRIDVIHRRFPYNQTGGGKIRWLKISAVTCLLSAGAVALDMALRVYFPAYTQYQLDRIPYKGRGCVREWCFSNGLAWMNAEISVALALIFITVTALAAGVVLFLHRVPFVPLLAALIYDLMCFYIVVLLFLPLFGFVKWTGPAVFDVGFAGGIIAVLSAMYGVTLLSLARKVK